MITRRSVLAGLLSAAAVVPARPTFASGGYVGGVDLGSGDRTIAVLRRGEFWMHAEDVQKIIKWLNEGGEYGFEEETRGPPPPDARPEGRGRDNPNADRYDGVPRVWRAEPRAADQPRGTHRHETPRVRQVLAQVPHARGHQE